MATKKRRVKITRITPEKVASLFDKDYKAIISSAFEDGGWYNVYDVDPEKINPDKSE